MAFNSLEAQREACEAYIQSQRHEGWKLLPAQYDDGGFSGGSMDRPALKRLLADIDAGRVDTVVVYKVDRLTRSLADFAKIVEAFDAQGISFISVTQQFNTTTSMGRLTLNVLLSFAQFEREVTGERIRDKIAASKRKGMWMGGRPPLGYTLDERKLRVDPEGAKRVRDIYARYLVLRSVDDLKRELDRKGIKSHVRVTQAGIRSGGLRYSRGALYGILRSCVYVGRVPHKDQSFPGEHDAIVPEATWNEVQAVLAENKRRRQIGNEARDPSLLAGLIYDESGVRLTPTYTVKDGKRYRYYMSPRSTQRLDGGHESGSRLFIPAHEVEALVSSRVRTLFASPQDLLDTLTSAEQTSLTTTIKEKQALLAKARQVASEWSAMPILEHRAMLQQVIKKIVISESTLEMWLSRTGLGAALRMEPPDADGEEPASSGRAEAEDTFEISIQAKVKRCGKELRLIVPAQSLEDLPPRPPVPALLKLLARAHECYERLISGEIKNQRQLADEYGMKEGQLSRIVQCRFLAPDIVEGILEGTQPAELTVEKLLSGIPMAWPEQRQKLGFPIAASR